MKLTPYELSKTLTSNMLTGQFILCKQKAQIPASWNSYTHSAWKLGICPNQNIISIKDTTNQINGWFIGHPLDIDQQNFIRSLPKLPENTLSPFSPLESYIDSLVGRYIFIGFHLSGETRVYLDSVGALSAVYSETEQILAANPMLIPYRSKEDDHIDHIKLISPATQNRSFHFGLTPRRSVKRLLPNHYLDLRTWKAIRHWPKAPIASSSDIDTTLEEIISILQTVIKSTVHRYKRPYLSLTAGRDSRSLLACARPWIDKIDCFTWTLPDPMAKEDVEIAEQLSARNNFNHFVIPYNESSDKEKLLWLYRTGCSAGELRGMKIVPAAKELDYNRPHLISLNAEIGRSHLNKPHHPAVKALTPERIVRRVGQLISDEFLIAGEKWLDGLSTHSNDLILDLAFLEQRLGCWVGVTGYGHAESAFRVPPFSSRNLYTLILSLPLAYRQNEKMPEDIIRMSWPKLLDIPFSGK